MRHRLPAGCKETNECMQREQRELVVHATRPSHASKETVGGRLLMHLAQDIDH